jgi:hypothetical protein
MRPDHGGRVLLSLRSVASEVVYDVSLATPAGEWLATARISHTGQVELAFAGTDRPPAWLSESVHALLRLAWRDRQSPDPARWPRRIQRWKKAPDEG